MSLSLILVAMFEQPTPPNLSYHIPTPVHAISQKKEALNICPLSLDAARGFLFLAAELKHLISSCIVVEGSVFLSD